MEFPVSKGIYFVYGKQYTDLAAEQAEHVYRIKGIWHMLF